MEHHVDGVDPASGLVSCLDYGQVVVVSGLGNALDPCYVNMECQIEMPHQTSETEGDSYMMDLVDVKIECPSDQEYEDNATLKRCGVESVGSEPLDLRVSKTVEPEEEGGGIASKVEEDADNGDDYILPSTKVDVRKPATKDKPFDCPHCDRLLSSKNNLSIHLNTFHGMGLSRFNCETCGKRCASKFQLTAHMRSHTGERPFVCQHCNRGYSTKKRLTQHVTNAHDVGPSLFACETCGQRCETQSRLVEHQRIHTGERPFVCPHCDKSFGGKGTLANHLEVLHGMGPSRFTCETCGRRCGSRGRLEKHALTHRGERALKCPHCEHAVDSEVSLAQHLMTSHALGSGRAECETCGKQYTSQVKFDKHRASHTRVDNLECQHCSRVFTCKGSLKDHINVFHGAGPSRFECEHCGRRCSSQYSLDSHVRRHTGERPFPCTRCTLSFKGKGALKNHTITVHGIGTCRFACEICGRRCNSNSSLTSHVSLKHNGERPFECPLCGKGYSTKLVLKTHIDGVHGQEAPPDLFD